VGIIWQLGCRLDRVATAMHYVGGIASVSAATKYCFSTQRGAGAGAGAQLGAECYNAIWRGRRI